MTNPNDDIRFLDLSPITATVQQPNFHTATTVTTQLPHNHYHRAIAQQPPPPPRNIPTSTNAKSATLKTQHRRRQMAVTKFQSQFSPQNSERPDVGSGQAEVGSGQDEVVRPKYFTPKFLQWQLNPQTLVLGKLKLYAVVWVDPNAKLYAVVWVDLIGSAKLPLQEVVDDVGFGSLLEKKLELKRPSGRPHGKLEVNGSVREPRYRVPEGLDQGSI
ncbi:C2 domain-containing protein [Forsythia ovata]|uniref:C2 domain-containing protein n=1 Tax=Forsythia ovata TaxID=205694 RepID=A0ABD1WWS0_9LAMI